MRQNNEQISNNFLFLIMLILLQGCAIYEKTPVQLDTAVLESYPVKIETFDGKSAAYHHVELKEGEYYGVKHIDRRQFYEPLKKAEINTIYKKNVKESSSKNLGIGLFFGGLLLVLSGIIVIY